MSNAYLVSVYCRLFNVYLWRKTWRNLSGDTCRLGIRSMLVIAPSQMIYLINILYFMLFISSTVLWHRWRDKKILLSYAKDTRIG